MITLALERAEHGPAIERLLDSAFGEDRWQKTCQRLRDGQTPIAPLCLVALNDDEAGEEAEDGAREGTVVGTVRLWPIKAGRRSALLLGPLAVDAAWRNHGIGGALMRESVVRAAAAGESAVLLVGDAPYYQRFGFSAERTRGLWLPGPVDRARFLARELVPGALKGAKGLVTPDRGCRRPALPLAA